MVIRTLHIRSRIVRIVMVNNNRDLTRIVAVIRTCMEIVTVIREVRIVIRIIEVMVIRGRKQVNIIKGRRVTIETTVIRGNKLTIEIITIKDKKATRTIKGKITIGITISNKTTPKQSLK